MMTPDVGLFNEAEHPLKPAVGALLFNAEGEVLAISRKTDQQDFGIVGGGVEDGETEIVAFLRELWEETGVRAMHYQRVFGAVDAKGCWMVTFLVRAWKGVPHDRERKGAIVRWLPPARLLESSCSFRAYNRALFAHLGVLPPASSGPG